MLDFIVDYNDRNNAQFSNDKFRQSVSKVMTETEEEEREDKCNSNNVTMDNFYHQPPVTTNTQGKIANVKNERQISLDILAETIKGFNGLTMQWTINDSAYYDSEEDDTESDPNRDTKLATNNSNKKKRKVTDTDTNKKYHPRKLLTNQLIPEIIPVEIPLIDHTITEDATVSGETLHARRTILLKDIVTDAAHSTARVFQPHDTVLTGSPNFVNLRLSSIHTSDELGSVFIPTTRIGTPTYGLNWSPPVHKIGEVT